MPSVMNSDRRISPSAELGPEHAECPVLRPGLITRDLDDSLEHGGQLQVRRDREDRIENPLHLAHAAKRSLRT